MRKKGNRNYALGAAFERRVKKHLEKQGYLVIRAAGSHGPVDLVAIPTPDVSFMRVVPDAKPCVRLIQCKRSGKLSKKDNLRLQELDRDCYGCIVQHAFMPGKKGIEFETIEHVLVQGYFTY